MSQRQRMLWVGIIWLWLGLPPAMAQSPPPGPSSITPPPTKSDAQLDADHKKELDRLEAQDPAQYRTLLAGVQVTLARLGYVPRTVERKLQLIRSIWAQEVP